MTASVLSDLGSSITVLLTNDVGVVGVTTTGGTSMEELEEMLLSDSVLFEFPNAPSGNLLWVRKESERESVPTGQRKSFVLP